MQVISTSPLLQLRERLDITREDIVRRANVTVGTVRNAEKGLKVTRRSAVQILNAVNSYLRDTKQSEVTLDDLGFTLKEWGDTNTAEMVRHKTAQPLTLIRKVAQ